MVLLPLFGGAWLTSDLPRPWCCQDVPRALVITLVTTAFAGWRRGNPDQGRVSRTGAAVPVALDARPHQHHQNRLITADRGYDG